MSTVPEAERTQPFHTFTQARTNLAPEQARPLGRIRWGSAFFGWVTAIGTTALLGAIVTAGGAAMGLVNPLTAAPGPAPTMGVAGAVLMLVAIFVGYYCGGYVAGRMARFAGARQGVAVWLWTLFLAGVGAGIATGTGGLSGAQPDALVRLPMSGGLMSGGGLSPGGGGPPRG